MIHRLLGEVENALGSVTMKTFLNERGRDDETPLHWACKYGKVAAAKALLAWGPDLGLRAPLGKQYDEQGNNITPSQTAMDMAWCHVQVDGLVEYMRPLCIYAGMYLLLVSKSHCLVMIADHGDRSATPAAADEGKCLRPLLPMLRWSTTRRDGLV